LTLREVVGTFSCESARVSGSLVSEAVMKVLLVTPRVDAGVNLTSELKRTERRLRGRGTTLMRVGAGKWKHVSYPGWIKFAAVPGGILVAEIQTRQEDNEWQLLQSFIGYLDRHLGEYIESIAIQYR
jgi:hypothetical protein